MLRLSPRSYARHCTKPAIPPSAATFSARSAVLHAISRSIAAAHSRADASLSSVTAATASITAPVSATIAAMSSPFCAMRVSDANATARAALALFGFPGMDASLASLAAHAAASLESTTRRAMDAPWSQHASKNRAHARRREKDASGSAEAAVTSSSKSPSPSSSADLAWGSPAWATAVRHRAAASLASGSNDAMSRRSGGSAPSVIMAAAYSGRFSASACSAAQPATATAVFPWVSEATIFFNASGSAISSPVASVSCVSVRIAASAATCTPELASGNETGGSGSAIGARVGREIGSSLKSEGAGFGHAPCTRGAWSRLTTPARSSASVCPGSPAARRSFRPFTNALRASSYCRTTLCT